MVVSRYMQSPHESHELAIKQIHRYAKGIMGFAAEYERVKIRLIEFCDSSHKIDSDDGRSTISHIFNYENKSISWCSQKQGTVALSSCEPEYMAAFYIACQVVWLRELLGELLS
ncbi:secreted RxLR effector protein 161-like [Bidens hawaiensis]|uniref:secreted RxLR effector protein 161-like n=1 Tax=Bidens hawaiensis TaxID=980011 RepID=UPI004049C88A